MRTRRSIAAVMMAAVTLVAVACSDGSDEAESDDDTTTTTTVEATTTTLSDEDYSAAIDEFRSQLTAAGTELCEVIAVETTAVPPEPANPAQMEQVIGIYTDLLRAYAGTVPDDPDTAAAFTSAADELAAEAAEAGYPVDFLSGTDQASAPAALSSEAYIAAGTSFTETATAACQPAPTDSVPTDSVPADSVPAETPPTSEP